MMAVLGTSMNPWLISAGLTAFLAAAPVAAQLIPLDPVPETVGDASQAAKGDQLSFSPDRFERMTVAVHVSGQGPFRFLVDTAADRSAAGFLQPRVFGR